MMRKQYSMLDYLCVIKIGWIYGKIRALTKIGSLGRSGMYHEACICICNHNCILASLSALILYSLRAGYMISPGVQLDSP